MVDIACRLRASIPRVPPTSDEIVRIEFSLELTPWRARTAVATSSGRPLAARSDGTNQPVTDSRPGRWQHTCGGTQGNSSRKPDADRRRGPQVQLPRGRPRTRGVFDMMTHGCLATVRPRVAMPSADVRGHMLVGADRNEVQEAIW
jgi:hypothetical protein